MTNETSTRIMVFDTGKPFDEWPMFRGDPTRSGYRPSQAVPNEQSTVKWRFDTDDSVMSTPAVAGGTVYIGSNDSHLYAVDAETGDEQWRFKTGDTVFSSPAISLARGSITADDDEHEPAVAKRVYVGSHDQQLYAVDAKTGEECWQFETAGSIESSPAVVDDVVYFGSGDTHLYAVDAETGAEKWRFETGRSVFSSPSIDGETVYVGSDDQSLYAVDAETGREHWQFETSGKIRGAPSVDDKTVYFGSGDEHLYAVDAETGEQQWRFETGGEVTASPAVGNGTVVVNCTIDVRSSVGNPEVTPEEAAKAQKELLDDPPKAVYAVDAETGRERWSQKATVSLLSSPTMNDDTVLVGHSFSDESDSPDQLYAIDLHSGEFEWTIDNEIETSAAIVGAEASSPVFVDGVVFAGSYDDALYAVTPLSTIRKLKERFV